MLWSAHKIEEPFLLALGLFLYRIQSSSLANLCHLANQQEVLSYLNQERPLSELAFYSYLQYQSLVPHKRMGQHFRQVFSNVYLCRLGL